MLAEDAVHKCAIETAYLLYFNEALPSEDESDSSETGCACPELPLYMMLVCPKLYGKQGMLPALFQTTGGSQCFRTLTRVAQELHEDSEDTNAYEDSLKKLYELCFQCVKKQDVYGDERVIPKLYVVAAYLYMQFLRTEYAGELARAILRRA